MRYGFTIKIFSTFFLFFQTSIYKTKHYCQMLYYFDCKYEVYFCRVLDFLSKSCLVAIRCCLHVAMACHYFSARWLDHNLVQNDIY